MSLKAFAFFPGSSLAVDGDSKLYVLYQVYVVDETGSTHEVSSDLGPASVFGGQIFLTSATTSDGLRAAVVAQTRDWANLPSLPVEFLFDSKGLI